MSDITVATLSLDEASRLAETVTPDQLVHLLDECIGLILSHKNDPQQQLYYGLASVFREARNRRSHWW